MMAVYRVARVVITSLSPVARIDATDAEGHELRLEAPVAIAQQAAAGRVLVVQWSLHDLPATLPQEAPAVERPQAVPMTREATGNLVDEAFMNLMDPGRHGALKTRPTHTDFHHETQPSTTGAPDISDEFNTLLGTPRRKG